MVHAYNNFRAEFLFRLLNCPQVLIFTYSFKMPPPAETSGDPLVENAFLGAFSNRN